MKKFIKVVCYCLLAVSMVALIVSTYLTSSGVNEWWNDNVSQWVGGASLAVFATTIIQLVINFSSKSNLELGIRDLGKSALKFTSDSEKISSDTTSLLEKLDIKEKRLDDLIQKYENSMQLVSQAIEKIDVMLDNQKQIALHNERMIKDGSCARLNKKVASVEAKYNETRKDQ